MKSHLSYLFRLLLTLALLIAVPWAPASGAAQGVAEQNVLEVFVREGCPRCTAAKDFLAQFSKERPNLHIVLRQIDQDENARIDLLRHFKNAGIGPPGVPTFVYNKQMVVGFESGDTTGAELSALIDRHVVPAESVESRLFGTLSVTNLGLPLFTLALGLLDGFNPCAMWVLLFLLSLLVHLHDRKRMALIAGTFVLVSGAVYYAFMAAWLNVFLLIGISSYLRWALGGAALAIGALNIKDFLGTGKGYTLSIPDSAKPGLYARMRRVLAANTLLPSLTGIAALAVVVNFIELLCTAGFPAIYTAVLTQQDLTLSAHYAYLGLYILGYIADDSIMVAIAVIALSSGKLSEHAGRWLKFLSGTVMLALGAIMILRPEWLT
jgi:glutaredoxin